MLYITTYLLIVGFTTAGSGTGRHHAPDGLLRRVGRILGKESRSR